MSPKLEVNGKYFHSFGRKNKYIKKKGGGGEGRGIIQERQEKG